MILALKHSPSKKKGMPGRQRSVTTSEVEGKTPDQNASERTRSATSATEETGTDRDGILPAKHYIILYRMRNFSVASGMF